MYELDGNIKDFNIDFLTGKALLTLAVNQKQSAINCWDELKSRDKLTFQTESASTMSSVFMRIRVRLSSFTLTSLT